MSTKPSSCPDVWLWLKRIRVILLKNDLESPFFLEISIEVEEIQIEVVSLPRIVVKIIKLICRSFTVSQSVS